MYQLTLVFEFISCIHDQGPTFLFLCNKVLHSNTNLKHTFFIWWNRTLPVKTTRQVKSLAFIKRSLFLVLCFQVTLVSVAEVVRAQGCPGGSSVTCGECDCNCAQSGTSSSDPFGLNSLINSIFSFLNSLLASVLGSTSTVSSMMWSSHRSRLRIQIPTFVYVESCFVNRSPMFKSTHHRYFFTYICLKVFIFIKVFFKHSWFHTDKK